MMKNKKGKGKGKGRDEDDAVIPLDQLPDFSPKENRQTSRRITKYEKARLLGTRAMSINYGELPLVKMEPGDDPLTIARKEYAQKVMPAEIRRHFPDGTYEDWDVNELISLK